MPRIGRKAPGGLIYHVFNRGNGRQRLFRKPQDYDAFIELLLRIQSVVPVRILAVCLMPNHWHLVLWPRRDGELSNFMLRLATAHVRRHFAHTQNAAGGHLYQGRFKSFPVQDDFHLLVLLRYVEANAVRAGLVNDPDAWRWSSFALRRNSAGAKMLHDWPIAAPAQLGATPATAAPGERGRRRPRQPAARTPAGRRRLDHAHGRGAGIAIHTQPARPPAEISAKIGMSPF